MIQATSDYLKALDIEAWTVREAILPDQWLIVLSDEDEESISTLRVLLSRILSYLDVDEHQYVLMALSKLQMIPEGITRVLCFGCQLPAHLRYEGIAVATTGLLAMEKNTDLKKGVFHDIQPLRH